MSGTAHIRSIRVAKEPTFGNVSATTGLPSTNGLTLRGLEAERAALETFGDPTLNERAESRDGPHVVPAEPDTVWASGARVQRRQGTIALQIPLRPLGTGNTPAAITNYASLPLAQLLNSGLWKKTEPVAKTLTLSSAASATELDVTTGPASTEIGSLLTVAHNGRQEFTSITDVATNTLKLSPALSATLSTPRVLRDMATYYVHNSLSMSALGTTSVCIVLDGIGWKTIAHGCRMESMALSFRGHQAMLDITMRAAYIKDDHANADVAEPSRTNGAPVHKLNSYMVISSAAATDPLTAPAQLAREAVSVDEIALSLTNTLTPRGYTDNVLGMSELEITNVEIALDLTLSAVTSTVADDFKDQVQRSVLIGLAGELDSAVAIAEGNGACFYLPAATLKNDPQKRELGGDLVRQVLNYAAGRFQGEDGSNAWNNVPFKMGLGR